MSFKNDNMSELENVTEFLGYLLKHGAKLTPNKVSLIASQFASLKSFKDTDMMRYKFVTGVDKQEIKLTHDSRTSIEAQKKHILSQASIHENWIRYLAHRFVNTQLKNIQNISLDKMNMNPFLIKALNLATPHDVISFNVFQTCTRSIVTSMGFTLEQMVGHSGARMGKKGEWFDVVKETDNLTHWIQVKSGPNDVDKDQVKHFNDEFKNRDDAKNKSILGIVYGKKTVNTISMNHIKTYLDHWDKRLLVGKELWDHVSGKEDYHKDVLDWIGKTCSSLLKSNSIYDEIQKTIKNVTKDFEGKYGTGSTGVKCYLNNIL